MDMSKIITIAGQKGGSGRSTAALGIASSLALMGKNTLLIDFDPGAYATQWSGIRSIDYNCDMATVLSGRIRITDAIVKTQFNTLDLLPSGLSLFQAALKLSKTTENQKILKLLIKDVDNLYDYIIIDPPASYDFLSIAAITAANWLVVCMNEHGSSEDDFRSLLKLVKYIRQTHDVSVKIAGILRNRCCNQSAIDSFLENQELPDIRDMVFKTVIPDDATVDTAIAQKTPLALLDIKCPAAAAYLDFSQELHIFLK